MILKIHHKFIGIYILLMLILVYGCNVSDERNSANTKSTATFEQGEGWRVVSHLTDGLQIKFVELDPKYGRNRAKYDEIARKLCQEAVPHKTVSQVSVYFAGDSIPANLTHSEFKASGGYERFPAVAVFWYNENSGSAEWTTWDCARAGAEGAPASALCGK